MPHPPVTVDRTPGCLFPTWRRERGRSRCLFGVLGLVPQADTKRIGLKLVKHRRTRQGSQAAGRTRKAHLGWPSLRSQSPKLCLQARGAGSRQEGVVTRQKHTTAERFNTRTSCHSFVTSRRATLSSPFLPGALPPTCTKTYVHNRCTPRTPIILPPTSLRRVIYAKSNCDLSRVTSDEPTM